MTQAPEIGNRASRRGWILGAFVLGLALGLLLAWRVWPAKWVDTDPSDLRAEHQRAYVSMVADSYSVTGNINEARERLYELVDDDTDWSAVDALVGATADELEQAGNPAAALRVRRMHEGVPLPVEAAAAPVATVETEDHAPASPRWALVLAGLGIVAMVIALVIWLITNEMRRREGLAEPEETLAESSEPYRPRPGRALSLDPVPGPGDLGIHAQERQMPRWDDATFMVDEEEEEEIPLEVEEEEAEAEEDLFDLDELEEEEELDEWAEEEVEEQEQPLAQRPDLAPEEAWHVETSPPTPSEAETTTVARRVDLPELDDEDLELVEEEEIVAEATVSAGEGAQLATFEATYRFGEDDFYHAFTIESPEHEFLGQCGIVISDVLGIEGAQLVDAFDLWLFETRGTRTVSKVLASEYAYSDDDLGAKLARKGELVLAEEGLVVTLQTESLRLSATIRELAYRDDQVEPDSVFDRLQVALVVERVGA